jgi:type II secretion system protein G
MTRKNGFTLVELLVVIAILGVLVSIALVAFRSSQARGRDAQRKSDLKQLSSSLELFYSDYGSYPSDTSSVINACPYNSGTGAGSVCTWGTGEFTDGKTVYIKTVPKDPTAATSYVYRIVPGSANQKFQLFARLENSQDPQCLGGDCSASTVSYACGTKTCNFAITSPNTKATE